MTPKVAIFPMLILLLVVVIPLLVLFIRLLIKKPKLAIILVFVPIIILFLMFFTVRVYREQQYRPSQELQNNVTASPFGVSPILILIVFALLVLFITLLVKKPKFAIILVFIPIIFIFLWFYKGVPVDSARQISQTALEVPTAKPPVSSYTRSPIWSEGIEEQFEADVYPSGISAIRAAAPQVIKQIPYVMGESGSPEAIVIYSNPLGIQAAEEFRNAVSKLAPEIKSRIEISNTIGVGPKEVGVHFDPIKVNYGHNETPFPYPANVSLASLGGEGANGTIQVRIHSGARILDIKVNYINKSWIENFAAFSNNHSNKHYIIAKSAETSIRPEEAYQQALNDALVQIRPVLANTSSRSSGLNSQNILASGLIVDKFAQSFNGTAGKIWREALLLDVSADKLQRLADNIAGVSRSRMNNWAQIIFSILGMLLLITVVYVFLNAATKGYYNWSLRIVGAILALILLFIILFHA